ncbi:hypothetical protein SAMCCGM7_Ch2263 [Sinorhizobium americanum CCGM7]|nr:hypothetical protein SAMCCGM7_Ch2263 [Sinorhizobium americanum CCGM7]
MIRAYREFVHLTANAWLLDGAPRVRGAREGAPARYCGSRLEKAGPVKGKHIGL